MRIFPEDIIQNTIKMQKPGMLAIPASGVCDDGGGLHRHIPKCCSMVLFSRSLTFLELTHRVFRAILVTDIPSGILCCP